MARTTISSGYPADQSQYGYPASQPQRQMPPQQPQYPAGYPPHLANQPPFPPVPPGQYGYPGTVPTSQYPVANAAPVSYQQHYPPQTLQYPPAGQQPPQGLNSIPKPMPPNSYPGNQTNYHPNSANQSYPPQSLPPQHQAMYPQQGAHLQSPPSQPPYNVNNNSPSPQTFTGGAVHSFANGSNVPPAQHPSGFQPPFANSQQQIPYQPHGQLQSSQNPPQQNPKFAPQPLSYPQQSIPLQRYTSTPPAQPQLLQSSLNTNPPAQTYPKSLNVSTYNPQISIPQPTATYSSPSINNNYPAATPPQSSNQYLNSSQIPNQSSQRKVATPVHEAPAAVHSIAAKPTMNSTGGSNMTSAPGHTGQDSFSSRPLAPTSLNVQPIIPSFDPPHSAAPEPMVQHRPPVASAPSPESQSPSQVNYRNYRTVASPAEPVDSAVSVPRGIATPGLATVSERTQFGPSSSASREASEISECKDDIPSSNALLSLNDDSSSILREFEELSTDDLKPEGDADGSDSEVEGNEGVIDNAHPSHSPAPYDDISSNESTVKSPKFSEDILNLDFRLEDTSSYSKEGAPAPELDLLTFFADPERKENSNDNTNHVTQSNSDDSKSNTESSSNHIQRLNVENNTPTANVRVLSTLSPVDMHLAQLKESPLAQRLHAGFVFLLHTAFGQNPSSIFFEPDDGFRGAVYWCDEGRRMRSSANCFYGDQITHSVLSNAKFPIQNQYSPQFSSKCCSLFDTNNSGLHLEFETQAQRDEFLGCLEYVIAFDGDSIEDATKSSASPSSNPAQIQHNTPQPIPPIAESAIQPIPAIHLENNNNLIPHNVSSPNQVLMAYPSSNPTSVTNTPVAYAAAAPVPTPLSGPAATPLPPQQFAVPAYPPMLPGIRLPQANMSGPYARKEDILPAHMNAVCDLCNVTPIKGIRYRCTVCFDFDLCAKCESKNKHPRAHPLLKLQPCGLSNDVVESIFDAQQKGLRDQLFIHASQTAARGQLPIVNDVRFNIYFRKAIDTILMDAARLPPHVLQFLVEILVNLLTATDLTRAQYSRINLDDPGTNLLFAQNPSALTILHLCGFEKVSKSDPRIGGTPMFENELSFNKLYSIRIPEIIIEKLLRVQGGARA